MICSHHDSAGPGAGPGNECSTAAGWARSPRTSPRWKSWVRPVRRPAAPAAAPPAAGASRSAPASDWPPTRSGTCWSVRRVPGRRPLLGSGTPDPRRGRAAGDPGSVAELDQAGGPCRKLAGEVQDPGVVRPAEPRTAVVRRTWARREATPATSSEGGGAETQVRTLRKRDGWSDDRVA